MQVKLAVLHSELLRAKKTGSDNDAIERGIQKVTDIFLLNGYPSRVVKRSIFKVKHMEKQYNPNKNPAKQDNLTYISLPYIDDDLSRKINGKIRSSGLPIKIAWQKGQSVSNILIRSALNPPTCPSGNKTCFTCESGLKGFCTQRNVVYEIKCMLCQDTYIGETKRQVRLRFNEHLRDAKNRTRDTPFGEHMRACHSNIDITTASLKINILRRCKDVASLKITESQCIRNHNPKLNTQTSSWKLIAPPPYGSN